MELLIYIQSQTPLSRAAEKGNTRVVELLLENGAQPDFKDENKRTPLSRAIEGGNVGVVEALLAQGAKVDYKEKIVSKFDRSTGLMANTASFTITESK